MGDGLDFFKFFSDPAGLGLWGGGGGPEKPKSTGNLAGGDKRAPLSRRGSILPLIIGRDKVEPIVAWRGNLKAKKQVVGGGGSAGGKGGGGQSIPEQTITTYTEEVIHLIGIGPAFRLHRIFINEQNVFEGEVDSSSHPSGSTIDLGKWGSIQVWWGGADDGAHWNAELGIPESVFPYLFGVKWVPLELGQQRNHPSIEYDYETRPEFSQLVESEGWLEDVWEGTGKEFNVAQVIDGIESEDDSENPIIRVNGNQKKYFKPGGRGLLKDNSGLGENLEFDVVKSAYSAGPKLTNIYVDEEIQGATNDGKVETLTKVDIGGVNIAHAFCQLLFGRFPHGASFSQDLFDFASFEAWGKLMSKDGESLPMRISIRDGELIDSALGAILDDCGMLIPYVDGAWRFFPVRDDAGPFPDIPAALIEDPLPELTSPVNLPRVDRVVFWFNDKKRKFAKKTIPKDNDGVADLQEYRSAQEFHMRTVLDSLTGEHVAERRKIEKLSRVVPFRVNVGREAALIFPGQRFTCYDVPFLARAGRVEESFDNGSATIDAANDFYGHPVASVNDPDGGFTQDGNEDTDPDVIVAVGESTKSTKKKEGIVSVARVRGGEQVHTSLVYVSTESGAGFEPVGFLYQASPGGVLLDELLERKGFELEEGPTFTAQGPDISLALDLTGDDAGWRAGKQFAILFDPAVPGVFEVLFVKAVTNVSGDTWRLDGVIRARRGTDARAWAAGTSLVLATPDQVFEWTDPRAVPGATLYVKVSPIGNTGIPLDELDAIEVPIVGHSIAPPTPVNLRSEPIDTHDDVVDLNADQVLKWNLRLLDTTQGAGSFAAGGAYSPEKLDGHANLFIDGPDGMGGWTQVRQVLGIDLGTTSYTYTAADSGADFFEGLPAEIRVRLVTVYAGVERTASQVFSQV